MRRVCGRFSPNTLVYRCIYVTVVVTVTHARTLRSHVSHTYNIYIQYIRTLVCNCLTLQLSPCYKPTAMCSSTSASSSRCSAACCSNLILDCFCMLCFLDSLIVCNLFDRPRCWPIVGRFLRESICEGVSQYCCDADCEGVSQIYLQSASRYI